MEALFVPVLVVLAALGIRGVKVTSSSRSMLVERLGKYNRQLSPGLSLVIPGAGAGGEPRIAQGAGARYSAPAMHHP